MLSLRERLRVGAGRPLVVGHRGAMGYRPENTLASYQHALDLGADLVECDVHLTRDGRLAVIHDETVDRTTNGTGLVRDHTLAELQALDAGAWFGPDYAGEPIPVLEDLLAWAHARGVAVDIEVKNGPLQYPGIEEALVDALRRADMLERAIVIAFDHPTVQRVRALEPAVATGVLYAGRPVDPMALATAAGADALLPHWAYVTPGDVQRAHAAGLVVAPWVSSDPNVLAMLVAAGVDAIGTNHPDVLRAVVDGTGVLDSPG